MAKTPTNPIIDEGGNPVDDNDDSKNPGEPGTQVANVDEKPTATAVMPYAATVSADMLDIVRENMGSGAKFDMMQLPRVRIPTGGNTSWKLTTVDGTQNVPAIKGVIAHMTPTRAWWQSSFDAKPNQPPDCSSRDGQIGFGYRGAIDDKIIDEGGEPTGDTRYTADGKLMSSHDCTTCPLAEFGTKLNPDGTQGRGKACKEMRALFVVQEGNIIPQVVMMSPMSIRPTSDYFLALSGVGRRYYGVETEITLEEARNAGGILYAKGALKRVRNLEPDEQEAMVAYRTLLVPDIEANFEPVAADRDSDSTE